MEKLHFKTSSGIKSIVGKDLITDKYVAIFELAKNGYDAGASKIVVSFNNMVENIFTEKSEYYNMAPDIYENPHIIIHDNGMGMNKKDLEEKWLYLAYSSKKEGSKNDDRIFVGSKGIGRFSCDTLGEKLHLITKKKNENIEHHLFIEWSDFDKDLKLEFHNINVQYKSVKIKNSDSYTTISIGGLRHNSWHDEIIDIVKGKRTDRVRGITTELNRLKNPFIEDDNFNIYVGYDLSLKNPDQETKIKNNVANVLKDRTTSIEATIKDKIIINLYDRGELIYTATKENEIFKNTSIDISIHYLNTSAKSTFSRRMGMQPVQYGNIFIYKNNFRVIPYGEQGYDIFGLNLRKSQGYNRYIGTREIIGYIAIEDSEHFFKESSSRNNGFIENNNYIALKDFYTNDVHMLLERYIHLIKWGEDPKTNEEIFLDSSTDKSEIENFKRYITNIKKYNIKYFKSNIDIDKNNPIQQINKIIDNADNKNIKDAATKVKQQFLNLKKDNENQERNIQENQKLLIGLEQQNKNLKKLREESSYIEQITHHFKVMSSDLYYSTQSLNNTIREINNINLQNKALKEIENICNTQKELGAFATLLINTNLDLRSKQQINWYIFTKEYENNRKKQNARLNVICNISEEEFIQNWHKKCDVLQLQIALDNFYQNAYDNGATFLDILFTENTIIFSSNSKKIENIHLNKIFELGYTTKNNGTGIGLNQIKKFFSFNECNIEIQQDDNVNFVVTKKD